MSREIDERIVSMQFDNADFERNIETSIGTLDKLSKSLDNLSSSGSGEVFASISSAADNIDLSGAITAANAVREGFTVMEVAGITAIMRLTNAFMNFGQKLWAISFGQMKSGGMTRALNIEQAEFMLKGMHQNVAQIKEDAMYAVEDTAYGFDEAAKAAASFGTAGVKAGDEMKKALLGVSGVAAMTNRSYSEIADIYTKIAATGKLTSIYVDSFNVRGLNVLDALSKKLHVTQAQVKEMVSKGKIDFKTFAEAMEEAFGAHAKDADNTFQGSISNVKAALSRIGAEFATPIITDVIPVFHSLKQVINEIKTSLGPVISDFKVFSKIFSTVATNILNNMKQSGAITNVIIGIRYGLMGIVKILVTIGEAIREVFPNVKGITDLFRKIMLQLIPSDAALEGFKEILKGVLLVIRVGTIIITKFIESLLSLSLILLNLAGNAVKMASGFKETIDPIIAFINTTDIFDKFVKSLAAGVYMVVMLLMNFKEKIKELKENQNIISFMDNFGESFNKLADVLSRALKNVDWASVSTITAILAIVFIIEFLRQKLFMFYQTALGTFGLAYEIAKNFSNMFSNVSGLLISLRTTFDRMKFGIMGDVILKFALSVGVLSLSLGYLASIPSNDLMKAGVALIFVGGALAVLMVYLNSILGSEGFKSSIGASAKIATLSTLFISIGIAMGILTASITVFSKTKAEDLLKSVLTLYSLAAMMVLISKLAGTARLTGIVSLSIATLLLSKSLSNLKDMDAGSLLRATLAMASMITIASLALALATLIPISLKFLDFIAFGAMMIGLSYAVKILATIEESDLKKATAAMTALITVVKKLIFASALSFLMKPKGFINLGILLLALTGALYTLKFLNEEEINRGLKALKTLASIIIIMDILSTFTLSLPPFGMIILTAALSTLALAMGYLAKMDAAGLGRAVFAMLYLTAIVLSMTKIATMIDTEGLKTLPFFKMSACLFVISSSAKMLSAIPDEGSLKRSVASLYYMGALVLIMAKMANWLEIADMDGKIFMELGAAVVLLAFAVNILSSALKTGEDILDMYMAVIAVGLIAGELMIIMNTIETDKLPLATKGLIMLAAGVLILSGAVTILTLLPLDKALVATGLLALMALSLAAANNQLKADYEKANGFAIMAGAVAALSIIVGYLTSFDSFKLIAAAGTITLLAFALAAVGNILERTQIGLETAGAFGIMAAGLAVLAASLSLLAKCPWEGILAASVILSLLGLAIVGLGALVGHFPAIGGGLVVLSVAMVSFGATVMLISLSLKVAVDAFRSFVDTMILFGNTSEETIDLAISNLNRLIIGMESVAYSILQTSPTWVRTLSALGLQISAVIGSMVISISSFGGLGVLMFCQSVLEQLPAILTVLAVAMDAMGEFFAENEDRIYDFGFQIGKVLFDGIIGGLTGIGAAIWDKIYGDEMKAEAAKQAAEVSDYVNQTMVKNMDLYLSGELSAEQMVEGLRKGLENGIYSVEDVNRELAARGLEAYRDELGIASPAKEYIKSANFSWQGLIEGMKNGEYDWKEVCSAFGEMGVEAFQEKFNAENLLGGTLNFLNGGVDFTRAANAMTWNDEGALEEAWKVAGYRNASEYASYLESIQQEKEMQDMLGKIANYFGVDLEELNAALDPEGILDTTDALDAYSDSASGASSQTDKLKDSIKDALDVFTKFNDEATLSGREVVYNFMTQIKGVNTWSKELQELSSKGLNANFLQELADAGPEAYEKIHALYTMTDKELTLFNQMYAQKIVLERGTAQTIRNSFVKNGAMTVEAAEKLGEDITDGISNKISETGDKISKSEQKAIEDAQEELEKRRIDEEFVAKWAQTATSAESKITLSNAFTELGYTSMEALEKSVNFEVIMDKLILFKNSVKEQVKSGLNLFEEVTKVKDEDKISADKMLHNMTDQVKKIGRWATNLKTLAGKGLSEGLIESLRALGPEGAEKVEAFTRMSAEQLKKANSLYASSVELPEYVSDKMVSTYAEAGFASSLGLKKGLNDGKDDLMFAFEDTGYEASQGFVKGVDPDAANEVMHKLGHNSLSALKEELDSHSPSKKAEEIGVWFVEGFTLKEKMDWAIKTISDTMHTYADAATGYLSEYLSSSKTSEVARYFVEGFGIGINKYSSSLFDSVVNVGSSIVSAFSKSLGVESPSVIAENIMEYFLKGAMIPLENDESVSEAAKSSAKFISDMFREGLFEDGFENDIYTPTIRPIWDDVNISNGLIGLQNGVKSFSLSGAMNNINMSKNNVSQETMMIVNAIKDISADQKAIRQELASLRSDTANLGNRIDGMSVYLDGSALVGQIVNPMDQAMGAKVVRQKRRKG